MPSERGCLCPLVEPRSDSFRCLAWPQVKGLKQASAEDAEKLEVQLIKLLAVTKRVIRLDYSVAPHPPVNINIASTATDSTKIGHFFFQKSETPLPGKMMLLFPGTPTRPRWASRGSRPGSPTWRSASPRSPPTSRCESAAPCHPLALPGLPRAHVSPLYEISRSFLPCTAPPHSEFAAAIRLG